MILKFSFYLAAFYDSLKLIPKIKFGFYVAVACVKPIKIFVRKNKTTRSPPKLFLPFFCFKKNALFFSTKILPSYGLTFTFIISVLPEETAGK